MRVARFLWLSLVLLALPTMSPVAVNAKDKHVKVTEYEQGQSFCPHRPLTVGNMVVPPGRCYKLAILRDNRGAFLAFMDPSASLHSGEVEHLDSSQGRTVRGHIFFLVPMQSTSQIALIPVNTIQLIRAREEDEEGGENNHDGEEGEEHTSHSRLIVVLPNSPVPNLSVTFTVTFPFDPASH
jgi:hypothetical protein